MDENCIDFVNDEIVCICLIYDREDHIFVLRKKQLKNR